MRKTLTIWLCALILGVVVAAAEQARDDARAGTWSGTWEGEGSTGGFELTLEKGKDGPLTGRVSVTGEPTYKATLKTLTVDGNKLAATYDFPPAEGAEVVLAATFDGSACKGTWVLRERTSGNAVAQGTFAVAKK